MKNIVSKYVFIAIAAFILINVIVYFYTISQESAISTYLRSIYFVEWLPYGFGLICGIFMLMDRRNTAVKRIGAALFALTVIATIMDYFTGIVLFLLLVLANDKSGSD